MRKDFGVSKLDYTPHGVSDVETVVSWLMFLDELQYQKEKKTREILRLTNGN